MHCAQTHGGCPTDAIDQVNEQFRSAGEQVFEHEVIGGIEKGAHALPTDLGIGRGRTPGPKWLRANRSSRLRIQRPRRRNAAEVGLLPIHTGGQHYGCLFIGTEALDRPGNVEQSLPAGREEVNTMGVFLLGQFIEGLLDQLIFNAGHAQRPLPAVRLGNPDSPDRLGPVAPTVDAAV